MPYTDNRDKKTESGSDGSRRTAAGEAKSTVSPVKQERPNRVSYSAQKPPAAGGAAPAPRASAAAAVPTGRAKHRQNERIQIVGGADRTLLVTIMVLISLGSIMVFSASYADTAQRYGDSFYYIRRQIIWVALSLFVMFVVSRVPPAFFRVLAVPAFLITLLLLLVVLAMGVAGGGAQRWIAVGGLTFQPSELAKLTLVMMLAWYYSKYGDRACGSCGIRFRSGRPVFDGAQIGRSLLWGLLIPFCFIGLVCGLVLLEKHLSGVIILGLIGVIIMFVAGSSPFWLCGTGIFAGAGLTVFALATDYTKRRIDIWLNPELYPRDGGWQTIQGMLAIGSGGLFGLGLGNSRQKFSYVSQPQNDFIFTIVCEELGFIGAAAIIILFGIFAWRGCVIAMRAPDRFSSLLAYGITAKVVIQVLLNIAVVTNTIPNTGISLPFFSYGGSSLVILFVEMGILLSISKESRLMR